MLTLDALLRASVGLLPVLAFLAVLRVFDSYKLVSLRGTLVIILAGGAIAGVTYMANLYAIDFLGVEFDTYSKWIAPLVEESLKGLVVVELMRRNRIGFLVDAVITGFAVGTGFALVENLFYLAVLERTHIGVWIVRGFGTAIMHGGATALFGLLGIILAERAGNLTARLFLPGLLLGAVVHSIYNHTVFIAPVLAALGMLLVLPPMIVIVFDRSERGLEDWLEVGFSADAELLELINSGKFTESKIGRYLQSLKLRFQGPVVADQLCYLRLHSELALRAKGILMMRESGFEPEIDPGTRAKFDELRYLEGSIGTTGILAIKPFLHLDRKALWQLYMIKR